MARSRLGVEAEVISPTLCFLTRWEFLSPCQVDDTVEVLATPGSFLETLQLRYKYPANTSVMELHWRSCVILCVCVCICVCVQIVARYAV